MTLFLGIDVGTYGTKGVLVDAGGTVRATATRDHEMRVPRPGWAEHKPKEDWWADVTAIMGALCEETGARPDEIAAVGLSAIGPCLLPMAADGTPLTDAILYGVDTRAAAEIAELTDAIDEATLLTRCGNVLNSQSEWPKILCLRPNRAEAFGQAACLGTSTTWLVHRLTGRFVIDHYSAAGFTPLYDVRAQAWTDELADIAPPGRLPEILWTGEVAGHVTGAAAAETGLAQGTPVTVGTIDAAAEALSVGVQDPADMMLMYGSTIFAILRTAEPVADARLWSAPWLFPGEHAAMAGQATSGTLTHWFRDRFAREMDKDEAFAKLAAEAADSPPGAKGLIALPYFSGERTPIHDPRARGTFFGLDLTHSRGDLYRALIEGIAYGTRHTVEAFADAGQTPERVLAVGGGTQNALWLQATSDICGLTQIRPRVATGAAFGDAFLAALAVGAVDRGDVVRWNPEADRIEPVRRDAYQRQYPLFRRLYERTADIVADLSGVAT